MNKEIAFKRKVGKDLDKKLNEQKNLLKNSLTSLLFIFIDNFIKKEISEFIEKTRKTHCKKLNDLGIYNHLKPCNPDNVITNLSSHVIPERIKFILAFGLDFRLPVFKLNFTRFFHSFENFIYIVKGVSKSIHNDEFGFNKFINEIKLLSNKFYYNFKPYKVFSSIITKADIILLKKFSSNDSIVVCKPDKGNGVVIMDRNDYLSKMHKILFDKSKFNLVHENIHTTILHVEDRINRFINKLKKTKEISLELYNSLFVSGSNPGILYGLPKIHKVGNPMRPIFSAINTPSYNICKFFVPILKKLTTNEFTTDNSYNFVEKNSKCRNTKNLYMVSFDVESLFKNIPLEETINICILELFKNCNLVVGIGRENFKKLLELSVKN